MRSWSFLDEFSWSAPERLVPSWDNALPLIKAAHSRQVHDVDRLRRWLSVSDGRLIALGGDPLREYWASFRPLRLSREEDWSDWLGHLILTSSTGVFWYAALRRRFSPPILARPRQVHREWSLADGYRADLAIGLRNGEWIHVEVKVGDPDLKKIVGTSRAMRSLLCTSAVHDVLLLPSDHRFLWNLVVEDLQKTASLDDDSRSLASGVIVVDWHDMARGLRSALHEPGETLTWRVLARVFCGAVEQSLIGLPWVPLEGGLEKLSLLDVEHLVRFRAGDEQGREDSETT